MKTHQDHPGHQEKRGKSRLWFLVLHHLMNEILKSNAQNSEHQHIEKHAQLAASLSLWSLYKSWIVFVHPKPAIAMQRPKHLTKQMQLQLGKGRPYPLLRKAGTLGASKAHGDFKKSGDRGARDTKAQQIGSCSCWAPANESWWNRPPFLVDNVPRSSDLKLSSATWCFGSVPQADRPW